MHEALTEPLGDEVDVDGLDEEDIDPEAPVDDIEIFLSDVFYIQVFQVGSGLDERTS